VVIVNKLDLPIDADGAEDAPGDRIEKGFGQFPIIPGGDSGGIVRLGGGPQRAVSDPVFQQAADAGFRLVDDCSVQVQALGGVGLNLPSWRFINRSGARKVIRRKRSS
jgi:hypothetical protein